MASDGCGTGLGRSKTSLPILSDLSEAVFSLVVVVFIFAIYWNSLGGAFIWDDRAAIIQNPDVRGFRDVKQILNHDFWGQDITLADSHKSFRPFTVLSFRLDHHFYGLNALGYHVTNVLVYCLACLAVYLAARAWADLSIARLATLFFVLHPVHVEAVSSIVGRADCLCGVFYFASVWMYTHALRTTNRTASFFLCVSALVCGVIAGLSKEIGVTVFAVLVVIEVLEKTRVVLFQRLRTVDNKMQKHHKSFSSSQHPLDYFFVVLQSLSSLATSLLAVSRLVCIGAVLVLFFRFRYALHGEHAIYQWTIMENHVHAIPGTLPRFLSYAQSHFWYAFKLMYPRYLCFDYGFDCIPTIYSIFDLRNLLPLSVYISFISLVIYAFVHARLSLLLGLATFIISLFPALNIVMPVGTLLAERLLFVPSMGFCLVLAELLLVDAVNVWSSFDRIISSNRSNHSHAKTRKVTSLYILLLPVFVACALRVITRNVDWRTEVNMYSSALSVCPRSIKALSNFGMFATAQKRHDEALSVLTQAVEIYPGHTPAILNAGVMYAKTGRSLESIRSFEAVVENNDPSGFKAAGYLGQTLYAFADKQRDAAVARGLRRQALRWFEESIKKNFYPPGILHVAGSTAFDLGDYDLAMQFYQAALQQHDHLVAFRQGSNDVPLEDDIRVAFTLNQLANALNEMDRKEEALQVYLQGLELEPDNLALVSNAGLLLRRLGQVDKARELMIRAINMSGDHPPPALLNNLGSLELEERNFTVAMQLFQQALNAFRGLKDVSESRYRFDTSAGGLEEVIAGNIERTLEEKGLS